MTLSASQRGWGNPDNARFSRSIIVIAAGGVTVAVNRSVADIFAYLLTELARKYDLGGYADDWGYANRDVRGHPGVKSNHSWGLAVDLDATRNPMTTNLKASHTFVRTVVDPIIAPFHGRLLWGGEYAGPRRDYMHFEYVGTPTEAVLDAYRARALLEAPTEDNDMTPEQAKQLKEVHEMLTALVAPRLPGGKDRDPNHIDLGDVLNDDKD